ncbi:sugar phosphate isomerase/epimerase family protein [Algibacillus agarilyticus]|uniref:sugar phosphate isomerase/epimerase family protein n=1 Tax=Algibacillus agarilyticus TaxID=2234133 RepID=UPI000DD06CE1|nr:sugar phosphate isomerase/epimerase [Algibacillus agarilyticus]
MKFNYQPYIVILSLCIMIAGCSLTKNANTSRANQQSKEQNMPKISVQLWSVKDAVKADFTGTLTQISAMGFDAVEFAGEFGPFKNDAEGLKQFLDSLGLVASSAHIDFNQLNDENFANTIKFYQTLGVSILIDPWEERAWHPTKIDEVINELNRLADKLAPHGMQIGYHNHDKEFNDFNGATYWDHLAKNTKENVILQQDVGWTTFAGKDPIDFVKRYPGRTVTTHYKVVLPKENPKNYSAIIGQDMINWLDLSKVNIAVGGTKWFVIEQETYPEGLTPLESVAQSKIGLDKILAELK